MPKSLIPGDKTLQAIKPGDPRKRIGDGQGLYLLLFVKGGAHGWRFDYSHGGKRLTLSLGGAQHARRREPQAPHLAATVPVVGRNIAG